MTPEQLRCRCGECEIHTQAGIQANLEEVMARARLVVAVLEKQLGVPQRLRVNSAVRCLEHNRRVGGKKNSYHLRGLALDLAPLTCSPAQLYQAGRVVRGEASPEHPQRNGGLGHYATFVHIDVRGYRATKRSPEEPWRRGT
jgi:uncharacterized protein YcbK (DUF882 family)